MACHWCRTPISIARGNQKIGATPWIAASKMC
ncbi:hypothetical protein FJ418_05950 [Mesorhizobium sp. B2-8-3]|nr:hypothetical protein FJ418_05950 [Mesorhizobium sp. B2-8-3]